LPEGVPPESIRLLNLRVEGLEGLRLADVERLDQEEAAQRMGISRQTFGRLLADARQTVAEALTTGQGISIGGGVFRYRQAKGRVTCPHCCHSQPAFTTLRRTVRCRCCTRPVQTYQTSQEKHIEETMDLQNAKIAVASDDGKNVSSHFGRAPYYTVLTLKEGKVLSCELRHKFAPHHHGESEGERGHHGMHADLKHASMVESILDCQVVIARGMGDGAYAHLTQAGLTTILTALHTVDEVTKAASEGTLTHQEQRIHHHGQHAQESWKPGEK
jgi:predicted DNA-binding protein (UPF0251 family)/predicted Fe-Mo cluster-binding NifX family protein